jgi:hypothetical protein
MRVVLHYKGEGHFTLRPSVERTRNSSNLIGGSKSLSTWPSH